MSGAIDKFKSSIQAGFLEVGKAMNEGQGLSDMIKGYVQWCQEFAEVLFDAVKQVVEFVKAFSQLEAVQFIIETIKLSFETCKEVVKALIDIVMEIGSAFVEVFSTAESGLKESINLSEIFKQALAGIKAVIGFIVDVIKGLLKVFTTVVSNMIKAWNTFVDFIKNSPLGEFATKLFNGILNVFKKIIGKLVELWNKFKSFIGLDSGTKITVEEEKVVTDKT